MLYNKSWAVIIGIDKYENEKPLSYCVADANSIQSILINNFDFNPDHVTKLINQEASLQGIRNTSDSGGGIYLGYLSSPTMTNVTITKNTSDNGGGIYSGSSSNPTLTNSIIWDNLPKYFIPSGTANITYSDIEGEWFGTGNINADPMLIDPENGDYHLQNSSPCIDAGNPDAQYNDIDGSRNNMGAYAGPEGSW